MLNLKLLVLFALGATLCLGQLVMAATPPAVSPRVAMLTKALNLTSGQQAQAQQIFQNEHQQIWQLLTPEQQQARKARSESFLSVLKTLNLSAEQKKQIKAINQQARAEAQAIEGNTALTAADKMTQIHALRQATNAQILQVLTPEQQTQVQNAEAQNNEQMGLASLGLSEAQLTQLKQIRQQTRASLLAILTPAQQQQFEQLLNERKQGQQNQG